jgi:hypothetical protein
MTVQNQLSENRACSTKYADDPPMFRCYRTHAYRPLSFAQSNAHMLRLQ